LANSKGYVVRTTTYILAVILLVTLFIWPEHYGKKAAKIYTGFIQEMEN